MGYVRKNKKTTAYSTCDSEYDSSEAVMVNRSEDETYAGKKDYRYNTKCMPGLFETDSGTARGRA